MLDIRRPMSGRPKKIDEELHQERRVAHRLDIGVDEQPAPSGRRGSAAAQSRSASSRAEHDRRERKGDGEQDAVDEQRRFREHRPELEVEHRVVVLRFRTGASGGRRSPVATGVSSP